VHIETPAFTNYRRRALKLKEMPEVQSKDVYIKHMANKRVRMTKKQESALIKKCQSV